MPISPHLPIAVIRLFSTGSGGGRASELPLTKDMDRAAWYMEIADVCGGWCNANADLQ